MATAPESQSSTVDAVLCCRWMTEGEPEVWFFPGEPVHVERVYQCPICGRCARVEVTDREEADRLFSEVACS